MHDIFIRKQKPFMSDIHGRCKEIQDGDAEETDDGAGVDIEGDVDGPVEAEEADE